MHFDPSILNDGLELAMEFGEHWLEPVQERLGLLYPTLSATALNGYDERCREAMNAGHRVVAEVLAELGEFHEGAHALFAERLLARYSWVSTSNLSRLFSQGCYYAMK